MFFQIYNFFIVVFCSLYKSKRKCWKSKLKFRLFHWKTNTISMFGYSVSFYSIAQLIYTNIPQSPT